MNQNRILLATDFSDRDFEAFQLSCKLALDWNAKLDVVHVQDPREVAKAASLRTDVRREFNRFVPEDVGIEFEHHVLTGDAAEETLKFAEANDVALIVLGTHGRAGVQRFFSGSVAENIMRHAKCPVMTKRESTRLSAVHPQTRILVPVDFSVYGYAAVDFASQMALATSANLTICYVDDSEVPVTPEGRAVWDERQKELWNQLREFKPTTSKVETTHKLFRGEAGQEICDYANSKSYDFIVIGTHGRSGLTRAIMGSVAEHVVRHAECPVVSVKPSNKRAQLVV